MDKVTITPEQEQINLLISEKDMLQRYLNNTDYAVIKCYDRGVVFREEYPELYAERQRARERINEIENSI